MAHCPKCGKRLTLLNLSQFCPACGVNMRFVNFEENFYKEAKIAELSQANMHVKIKRLKASLIGSKLTIARLVLMIFPLVALLLPNGSFTFNLPFVDSTVQFGILGFVSLFTGPGLNYVMQMKDSAFAGEAFSALLMSLLGYIAIALVAVFVLLFSLLCFISIKKMQKVIGVIAGIGVIFSVVTMIMISRFVSISGNNPILSGKNGFGLILAIVMFLAVIVINIIIDKKGIPVEYGEGMLERTEIYKQVKAGKVDIDSLPQPVVETEETRKIDEKIALEEENYRKKHAKEVNDNVSE